MRHNRSTWMLGLLTLLTLAGRPSPEAASSWVRLPAGGEPRRTSTHALAYDPVRRMLVKFGGAASSGASLNETWELDITARTWFQRTPSTSPSKRYAPAMIYDEARRVMVLFGGQTEDAKFLTDTWLWDGSNWSQVFPQNAPSGRTLSAMVYDAKRQVVVLFGGYDYSGFNDLWEWNGQDWTERPATSRPEERYGMAFTYDRQRDVLVMFGGSSIHTILRDTWEWVNDAWVQRQPVTSPPAIALPAYGYSPGGSYTMIFGGQRLFLADTWTWDGTNWTQVVTSRHPSDRTNSPAAYVAPLRSLVLFGGYDGTRLNDTWAFRDPR